MKLQLEQPRIKTPTDRLFPRYYPGMPVKEYIRLYYWANNLKSPGFHFIKEKP